MRPDALIQRIEEAFAHHPPPAPNNITRCSYDRRNGGEFDGPCSECADMAEFFAGKSWQSLDAKDMRANGDADSLFTIEAYTYLLLAYLIAAVRDPETLDVCTDRLPSRFGPRSGDEYGEARRESGSSGTGRKRRDKPAGSWG